MRELISKAAQVPAVKTDPPVERYLKMLFTPELKNYENATVLFSYIPPGSTSGIHKHEDCDEIMYFLGQGYAYLGDEKVKIEDDLVIVAPKNIPHGADNTSETETMKIFCVYLPPLKTAKIHEKGIELSLNYYKKMLEQKKNL